MVNHRSSPRPSTFSFPRSPGGSVLLLHERGSVGRILPRTTQDSGVRHRAASSCVLLTALAGAFFPSGPVLAADSDQAPAAPAGCPEVEAVWSTVVKLVPGAASQLLAARPRVDVV